MNYKLHLNFCFDPDHYPGDFDGSNTGNGEGDGGLEP
jgi:hypothetical protein